MPLDRATLQALAEQRLQDCKALIDAGRPGGAYYIGGYAAECALKACIARKVRQFEFPDKKTVELSYSHKLDQLLRVAGLNRALEKAGKADNDLADNWNVVKDWTEESRYENRSLKEAQDLYEALSNPQHGVMQWLRSIW